MIGETQEQTVILIAMIVSFLAAISGAAYMYYSFYLKDKIEEKNRSLKNK